MTVPPPAGVAHVPSPRKKVVDDGVPVTGFAAILVTVLMIVPEVGRFNEVAALAVNVCKNAPACVTLPAVENVDPLASVRVAVVPGFVIVMLLTVVAVAAPIEGVVSVGLVARTMLPLPTTALPRAVIVPDVGNVNDVVPVAVNVCENAPDVANVLPLASVRVAVVPGFVIVTLLTVVAVAAPIEGVTSTGLVDSTFAPLPVLVVTPVPPCATGNAFANVTPVEETVICVTPAPCSARLPDASAVVTTPPPPVVVALIVLVMRG